MADWSLTPALVALRDEFNRRCPGRDRSSDGSIGDAAHASSASSHNPDESGTPEQYDADHINEVHAIDVDEDLRATDARGPFTMMRAVRQLVTDHREGRENRLTYIIYERTIWAASWGWAARTYTGANPHDKHAHLNGSYETAKERDTRPWNIGWEEPDMPLTVAEITRVANETADAIFTRRWREYHDQNGDGTLDYRALPDLLFSTHATVYRAAAAQKLAFEAILAAVAGDGAPEIARKLDGLVAQVADLTDKAEAEAVRDTRLRELVEARDSGRATADEIVDELARRLERPPADGA